MTVTSHSRKWTRSTELFLLSVWELFAIEVCKNAPKQSRRNVLRVWNRPTSISQRRLLALERAPILFSPRPRSARHPPEWQWWSCSANGLWARCDLRGYSTLKVCLARASVLKNDNRFKLSILSLADSYVKDCENGFLRNMKWKKSCQCGISVLSLWIQPI